MQNALIHELYTAQEIVPPQTQLSQKASRNKTLLLAKVLGGLGMALLIANYAHSAYFTVSGLRAGNRVSEYIANTAQLAQSESLANGQVLPRDTYQPKFDASLPTGTHINIPSIGVNTSINEASHENYEDALKKGVWRVTDFGTPTATKKPIILAAHRFGYLKWSNSFRRQNSFFNLPKHENGDTVEIVWNQKKYVYAIYSESSGEKIEDYSADLVLYTCNDLSSSVRLVKYLKLLKV